jgi:hypothetical protein
MSGDKVNAFIERLVKEYRYKPLPPDKSKLARDWYLRLLPSDFWLQGNPSPLFTLKGTQVANGYNRVVIGDYGAYIEFENALVDNMVIPKEQEYRQTKRFINNVKYLWYTAKDTSNCKIYFQLRTVPYADYVIGRYYVSPYEVMINEQST